MTKKQNIKAYEEGADKLIKQYNKLGPRVKDIKKAFSYVKKENPKVLELGCGSGRDAKEILKLTNDYTGIDFSKKMLDEARKAAPEGKFIHADFEEYEFPKKVDIIFAFASLVHSGKDSLKRVLEKAQKSLNDGGVFSISLKYGEYHKEVRKQKFGERTYYFYTPKEIKKLAPERLKKVYEDLQEIKGQEWFTIILQRV